MFSSNLIWGGGALFNISKHQTHVLNNPFCTPSVANLDTLQQQQQQQRISNPNPADDKRLL